MKLGIFGDSFADPIDFNASDNFAWPVLLSKEYNFSKKDCYARKGTSHWWSHEQFLKNYKKYDTIIFVHTSAMRWPYLPDDETGRHWMVGEFGEIEGLVSPLLRQINPHYMNIFSEKLLNFISQNIYRSVNEICRDHGIQLINVMPFETEHAVEDFGYPVLTGLTKISLDERVVMHGTRYTIVEALEMVGDIREYSRYCHLNKTNNLTLFKLVNDLINNKKTGVIDLTAQDCWTTENDYLNAYYTTKLKEQADV